MTLPAVEQLFHNNYHYEYLSNRPHEETTKQSASVVTPQAVADVM